jgi:hypothetical protein
MIAMAMLRATIAAEGLGGRESEDAEEEAVWLEEMDVSREMLFVR